MKVLYFGTYRKNYSRNKILIEGLRRNNVEAIECHRPLWFGIEDRVRIASGGWRSLAFWKRVVVTYTRLLADYFKVKEYDVLVCGYPGQLDVILAWLLSRLKRKPLVWDVFMSIYLISLERGLDARSKLTVALIHWLEKISLQLPELLIQDTQEYVQWFHETYKVSPERFKLIPTGADNRVFYPRDVHNSPGGKVTVLYYGTFISNHGVDVILEAAKKLSGNPNLIFMLIGDGPEREKCEAFARENNLTNVVFLDWVSQEQLAEYISGADICLGVFGDTPQSLMTVQNKIFECLAMKRPVITGNSPTIRSFFRHGEHLHICERNSEALASAITCLAENPVYRTHLAEQGYFFYTERFTIEKLGFLLKQYLERLLHASYD